VAFILTRINVGDYDTWKPQFDQDRPGARQTAKQHRLFRGVEDPNEVFILIEFASAEDAAAARERLLDSGVLDRFADKDGPTVIEQAEIVDH
jgi:histidinol-phosphate/aromatic aminotransferase/cobyric acid decarboxylase-like protein